MVLMAVAAMGWIHSNHRAHAEAGTMKNVIAKSAFSLAAISLAALLWPVAAGAENQDWDNFNGNAAAQK